MFWKKPSETFLPQFPVTAEVASNETTVGLAFVHVNIRQSIARVASCHVRLLL